MAELNDLNTKSLKLGLRFRASDAALLEGWTQRLMLDPRHSGTVGLFRNAAEATRKGEPLILICENLDEARAMAHGFVPFGIEAPSIESLSGLLV
jgi:hypothetical protein